ncbi:hypothetical protein SY88_18170 [Clostridiales bacterium PH28_bin88]|nr:hypothetical protein SY88_18170 [Clostridiales bacterium PH28_bin88]
MVILDIVEKHPESLAVFKEYERRSGACICCQSLFDPLEQAGRQHGIDVNEILLEINMAIERCGIT